MLTNLHKISAQALQDYSEHRHHAALHTRTAMADHESRSGNFREAAASHREQTASHMRAAEGIMQSTMPAGKMNVREGSFLNRPKASEN